MLISGILCGDDVCKIASLISMFFSQAHKKVSIIDYKNLIGLSPKSIKSYIQELEKNTTDILIFKINLRDMEYDVIGHINFDLLICSVKENELSPTDIDTVRSNLNKAFGQLDEKGISIINVDDSDLLRCLEGIKHRVVSYGFNKKASLTTSSIGDDILEDSFLCCVQRNIYTSDGTVIEPQEYRIKLPSNDANTHQVLAAATFALVSGADIGLLV